MIERAQAVEFIRPADNGRTGPLILTCETLSGEMVELFCKFSAGCDQGVINLAREAVAACLARDLELPVPIPYFVEIAPEFSGIVTNLDAAQRITRSVPLAFGSTRSNQFAVWASGNPISNSLQPTAAASLVFDGIIQNPDRRIDNPNCLVKGDEIRLIDHELAFAHKMILLWSAPWVVGGLQNLADGDARHIFFDQLSNKDIDWDGIKKSWKDLPDARLEEYERAIPLEWGGASGSVKDALNLIRDARDNIDGCIDEVRRILA
ncbi:HipA family kinase [Cochlodiniinecator piscidefendens]|uniref:HipA family kinase n=1 Tax=Cochlodiniinecator piscidefendens TaxID=2715756 RepID=UPI001409EF60|nr:HipA family kinase [Cochlodiniinecator piscidefendens]